MNSFLMPCIALTSIDSCTWTATRVRGVCAQLWGYLQAILRLSAGNDKGVCRQVRRRPSVTVAHSIVVGASSVPRTRVMGCAHGPRRGGVSAGCMGETPLLLERSQDVGIRATEMHDCGHVPPPMLLVILLVILLYTACLVMTSVCRR